MYTVVYWSITSCKNIILLWKAHGMCEAYYREKAGLSSGGSGLKYPMWNVGRSSLSTDKAKNMQWSVTLVHQVYRRLLLWLNVLWTVQGLDLEGIRRWQCWSWKSLSEVSCCSANATSSRSIPGTPGEGSRPRAPGRSVPVPRFILCFTQLFTHHRAGLASLKGPSAALQCVGNCNL